MIEPPPQHIAGTGLHLLLALVAALAIAEPAGAAGGSPSQPGAYCPLPEPGQRPVCLDPAQQTYGDFFAALSAAGDPSAAEAALTADLRGGTEQAILAVSTLSYGYFTVAQRTAETGDAAVAAQLQRWSELLALAYVESADDEALRQALRLAAVDLHARVGGESQRCRALPEAPGCSATSQLLRSMGLLEDPAARRGVRGSLSRLLMRFVEDPE